MVKRNAARLAVAFTGVIALLVAGPTAAFAAPTNDDYAAATAVDGLPYSTTADTTDATSDPSDPTECANSGSVWYSYTPTANTTIQADTLGSDYDTVLSAWTGDQGSLSLVACNDDYSGAQSRISFAATAGTTYHLMVSRCCSNGGSGGGALQLSIGEIQPAVNDDFADALAISSLPYSNTQDYSRASRETGEPTACYNQSTPTVWYSYTPTVTQSISANTSPSYAGIGVYTGSSLGDLTQFACRSTYNYYPVTFVAQAGTTYLFQVAADSPASYTFQLSLPPNPTAGFYYYPSDPNIYEDVTFSNYSDDPAGAGFSSYDWDFGDGTTGTGSYVSHRYPADGDYTARLTVQTTDGRTATTTQPVRVRTHDVSITRLNVPSTARAGQTIGVNVYVQNARYDDNVQVSLEKSSQSGFTQVGSLTQLVTVKTTGQTTRFSFNYTVTSADVSIGKITFRATATLTEARDALPADNQLTSTPVKVS